MNRREKALLTILADNLDKRAQNARQHTWGPADSLLESKGAAYAFQVAGDYLRGARDGHERLPPMHEIEAAAEKIAKAGSPKGG